MYYTQRVIIDHTKRHAKALQCTWVKNLAGQLTLSRASCRAIDSVPELMASASCSFCCSSVSCAAACSCFLAVSACSLLNLCCSLAPLCTHTKPSDYDCCKAVLDTAQCCSDPCTITIFNRSRLHQADTVTRLHRVKIQPRRHYSGQEGGLYSPLCIGVLLRGDGCKGGLHFCQAALQSTRRFWQLLQSC